jgi:dipeptidase D
MLSAAIHGLTPALLWEKFYEISQIPRASKNEHQVRLYLRNFAGQHNLLFDEDESGNVLIQVPPLPGYEKAPTVVLQGHVDMVCEKNRDTQHDFSKDPIKLVRDGNWIKADGTTLGADNGIGVAAALAVALDDTFIHGPVELLFTIDEETGLTGVHNLKKGFITGQILLNLDTEEDGAFYVGCAGGIDTVGTFNTEFEQANINYQPYSVFITGLKGGHSGMNIHEGRANAIKLLGYLLDRLSKFNYQLAMIQGGSKRNAIPREAEAVIYVHPNLESDIREIINEFSIEVALEYKKSDDDIRILFEESKPVKSDEKKVYKENLKERIINTIIALPHGVIAMNEEIPGLVETSTNLATIITDDYNIRIGTCQRSSVESSKEKIARTVKAVFDLSAAESEMSDGYPGWQPKLDSKILKLSRSVYKKMFNSDPEIKAVHAGLECGILAEKYPGLDMISLGPTIEGAHSPDERVNIDDVDKFYNLLRNILTEISQKK